MAVLNAIRLHEDHIHHGFSFLIAADFETPGAAAGRLLAYAIAEGLYPADVAAQAIAIRAEWLKDFLEAGRDPELGGAYAQLASAEIVLAVVGCLAGPGDDEEPLYDEISFDRKAT